MQTRWGGQRGLRASHSEEVTFKGAQQDNESGRDREEHSRPRKRNVRTWGLMEQGGVAGARPG